MTDAAVDVSVRLKLQDAATAGLRAAQQAAEQGAAKVGTATERAARAAADAAERGAARQRSVYERLAQSREVLGMRSEQVIRREIQQTVAAYERLKSSGNLSWREQGRAADQMRSKVRELTNEMGKLTTAQKAMAGLKFGMAAAAGLGAAAYTLKAPAQMAMSFDERLGLLANTAYAEKDAAGRRIGEAQLAAAVKKAVGYGMTKDAAIEALDKMIADDQVGGASGAMELLPYIAKVSTGSGSSGHDVAAMMGGFIGQGYAKDAEQAKRLMGISSAAATAGAFEKNDMAKHLPALLPLAKSVGLTGEAGFKKLLVLLQQARTTAGTSDEAANNVRNLLSKVMSEDTAKDFKKAGRGDLYKHMMQQRAKGVDALTAWQNVIDDEIKRNPNLKPAIARLQKARNPEEQEAAIQAIKGMAEGQSIGKYFQDMQAKGAVFGLRNTDIEKRVNEAISMAGTIVDADYEYMAEKAGVKTRVAKETADMAKVEAMDKLTPVIGQVADGFTELVNKNPALVGAGMLATTALTALAGASGLASVMLGGPGLTGAVGKASSAISGAASGIMGIASRLLGFKIPTTGGVVPTAVTTAGKVVANAGRAGVAGGAAGALSAPVIIGGAAVAGLTAAVIYGAKEHTEAGRKGGKGVHDIPVPNARAGAGNVPASVQVLNNAARAQQSPKPPAWQAGVKPPVSAAALVPPSIQVLTSTVQSNNNLIAKSLQPPKPQPVDLRASMQVGLSPGLVLQSQSTQASGATLRVNTGNTGNVRTGAPG